MVIINGKGASTESKKERNKKRRQSINSIKFTVISAMIFVVMIDAPKKSKSIAQYLPGNTRMDSAVGKD